MYAIGIDLGGTFTKLALVSQAGEILSLRKLPGAAGQRPEAAFASFGVALEEMAVAASLPYPAPHGCGIGIPAVVDYRTGFVSISGPLKWESAPVAEIAGGALKCTVAVDTDVNAGALADLHRGCAQDSSEMLYVSWGTGIGAAFVVARRLYHSRGGAMCNLGHMPAYPSSERLCYCGCRGCLEVEAGGRAMVEQMNERLAAGEPSVLYGRRAIEPHDIAAAAEAGDDVAREVLHRSAIFMARVLAGVLAFLNPDTVVFGGGVSRCFPIIQEVFDRELKARTPGFALPLTRVRMSQFGEKAGVVGAAMLGTLKTRGDVA